MLFKKYILIIISLSIIGITLISEFFILDFLSTNLKEANKAIPMEIRLPIINLAAYDTLYKKGEQPEDKEPNNLESDNAAIDIQPDVNGNSE